MNTSVNVSNESLEQKPGISSVRKAIQGAAAEHAAKEFLNAPEKRHIDAVIGYYKLVRFYDPKLLATLIALTNKGKDLKDELGSDLDNLITQVREKELTANMKEDIASAMTIVHETKGELSYDEENKELTIVMKRYLEEKMAKLKKDPRILSAFAGKEKTLDRFAEFVLSSIDIAQSLKEHFSE